MDIYDSGANNLKYDYNPKIKNIENANNEQNFYDCDENIDQKNTFKDDKFLEIKKKIGLMNQKITQMQNSFEKFEEIKLNQKKNDIKNKEESIKFFRKDNKADFTYDNYFLKHSPNKNNNTNEESNFLNCNDMININNFGKDHKYCFGTYDNYFLNRYDDYDNEIKENIINNNTIKNEENFQLVSSIGKNENFDNNEYSKNKKVSMNNEDYEFAKIYNDNYMNNILYSNNNYEKIIKKGNNDINNIFMEDSIKEEIKEEIKMPGTKNILMENNNKKENKNKKNKILVFCENENVTIKYDDKEKITEISIYNNLGKKLHFVPKNINVYLNKLKKMKLKSILLNSNKSNNYNDYKIPTINQTTKKIIKNSLNKKRSKSTPKSKRVTVSQHKKLNNTEISAKISPKKQTYNINICQKLQNKDKKTKRFTKIRKIEEKICEKFRSNPQKFYTEKLCDTVLKSLNISKDEILTKSLSQIDFADNNKKERENFKKTDMKKTMINSNEKKNVNKKKRKSKDDDVIDMRAFNNLKKYFEENNYNEE